MTLLDVLFQRKTISISLWEAMMLGLIVGGVAGLGVWLLTQYASAKGARS